jgi:hypothetical protein
VLRRSLEKESRLLLENLISVSKFDSLFRLSTTDTVLVVPMPQNQSSKPSLEMDRHLNRLQQTISESFSAIDNSSSIFDRISVDQLLTSTERWSSLASSFRSTIVNSLNSAYTSPTMVKRITSVLSISISLLTFFPSI